jgi:CheY-like chemotaxis protein
MANSIPITKRARILIVDDDSEIRDVLAEVLLDEGYSVGQAGDGAEALDALAATPADAILLDLNMPIMNGYQVMAARDADPRLANVPVVIMSASAPRPEATVGLCVSVLAKPLDLDTLLARLKTLDL